VRTRFIALLLLLCLPSAAAAQKVPTVDDLLNVKSAGGTQISPDGKWVAYTVAEADFKQNAFITQIWLANVDSGRSVQLTRGEKSSTSAQWSPDSQWLAFSSQRVGDKSQIFVLHPDGGEALQLTRSENSIASFSWSRDGKTIAFTASDVDRKAAQARQDYLGGFEVVREELRITHGAE
jgi:Tol biopolymer transport system component